MRAKGTNKRASEALEAALPIYYFEVHTQGEYAYDGCILSAGPPFRRQEPGVEGEERIIWLFPLRLRNEQFVARSMV